MNRTLKKFTLTKKIAVVTGGYGHLGVAFCQALIDAGAFVIAAGRSESKFYEGFKKSNLRNLTFFEMDVSDTNSIKNCFQQIKEKYSKIDILVNNAAFSMGQYPEKITDSDLMISFEGTFASVYKTIREIIPIMKEQKSGNIINISSMYGVVVPDFKLYEGECSSFFNSPQYGALKAGVIHLSKYFAEYLIPFNIRVNCISPGTFPSKEVQKNELFINRLMEKNPCNRIGVPDDLKGTVIFLASDASKYIIGQNIQVDGGWTIW